MTVIVCYKNAEAHIGTTINAILAQNYPDFDIIAIDDFSTDNGYFKLLAIQDSRLHLLKAEKDVAGKKGVLSEAICTAKNNVLLFTDADCIPSSDNWITSMVTKLMESEGTDIVLGYGPMNKNPGVINSFARFETVLTAMQYFSYAASGMPYMGVGRNLMYRKSLFKSVKGFDSHYEVISGDDDLFISMAANATNTAINFDRESFVYSDAKRTLYDFLSQKTRHISTSYHYNPKHQLLLGLFAASQIGFYVLILISLLLGLLKLSFILILILFKWLIQMILQRSALKKLDAIDLFWWFPVLDMSMICYYMGVMFFRRGSKQEW